MLWTPNGLSLVTLWLLIAFPGALANDCSKCDVGELPALSSSALMVISVTSRDPSSARIEEKVCFCGVGVSGGDGNTIELNSISKAGKQKNGGHLVLAAHTTKERWGHRNKPK